MFFNLTNIALYAIICREKIKREKDMAKRKKDSGKTDLRILKTKKLLKETLFSLLDERTLSDISVGDICSAAMVNRTTFYKHYDDKYDLLCDCVDSLQKSAVEKIAEATAPDSDASEYIKLLIDKVVTFCYENSTKIKKLTLQENVIASSVVMSSVNKGIQSLLEKFLSDKPDGELFCPIEYAAAFIAGGCYDATMLWLSHKDEYPKEAFAEDVAGFFKKFFKAETLLRD